MGHAPYFIDRIYTLVCSQRPIMPLWEHCIAKNRALCAAAGIPFEVVKYEIADGLTAATTCDLLRLVTACTIPRQLFIDADIRLLGIPRMQGAPKSASMAFCQCHNRPRTWMIYNGDNTALFAQYASKYADKKALAYASISNSTEYFRNKVEQIGVLYYHHFYTGAHN